MPDTAPSIAAVTPTLCRLFGITGPKDCVAMPFPFSEQAGLQPVTRALVFAADAIGADLTRSYEDDFRPVLAHTPIRVEARAVLPSVTPVCFASMFTGA